MTDELREEQIALEEKCRGETIRRFHRIHERENLANRYGDTDTGRFLIKSYFQRYTEAVAEELKKANSGKAGRKNLACKLLSEIEPEVSAYLFLKSIVNLVPMYHQKKPCSVTSLCIHGAGLIHDELRIRYFEKNWRPLARKLFADFEKRELPRYKRKELIRRQFNNLRLEWAEWSKTDMLNVGIKLLDIFKNLTGDVELSPYRKGKHTMTVVSPSASLASLVMRRVAATEGLYSMYYPMVIPPRDWTNETLERGGYLTHNVTPYPLVKNSSKAYRETLQCEDIPEVISSLNKLQRTPWQINVRVLEVFEELYKSEREIAGLPSSSELKVPEPPNGLAPDDRDSELSKEYKKQCYLVHEQNRRDISKRVATARIFSLAHQFKGYEEIYFPHNLDSRSRAYPLPALLNPQGPDLAKGLLEFAYGKEINEELDACALAFHGANCFGFDKGTIQERVDWVTDHEELIFEAARNPKGSTWWLDADSPAQFLAFCFEWEEFDREGYGFLSHIHTDVDATCSGLQHFAAALRDPMGKYVNMTPSEKREDVYQRCGERTMDKFAADTSDTKELSKAWYDFGMTRDIAKRPVMIIGYSGTFHACMKYVGEAVRKRLKSGEPVPWQGSLHEFITHGASVLWPSIAEVVPATVKAMEWLKGVSVAVAKSDPKGYVEWTTPTGFHVVQQKYKLQSRQIDTVLDGKLFKPRINEEKDQLDARQMGNSVPPSFVHSLDASHMHRTIHRAGEEGMEYFAAVHDSFGVHAADLWRFNQIIRESFVSIFEGTDVLQDFYESNAHKISEEFLEDIPEKPALGDLDLNGVLESDFFFS